MKRKKKKPPEQPRVERPPQAHGYGRVSGDNQDADGKTSIQLQESTVKGYYEWALKDQMKFAGFTSDVISGSIPFMERPEGSKLAARLQPGDAVLFSKLDRGFRNMRDVVNTVHEWMERGISVHFLDLRLDTSTPTGKWMMHILAATAEFERDRINERTAEGRRAKKAAGLPCGGAAPYGFKVAGKKGARYYVPNPQQRVIGKEAMRLRGEGWDYYEITEEFERRGYTNTLGKPMSYQVTRLYHLWEKDLQEKERLANLKKTLIPEESNNGAS